MVSKVAKVVGFVGGVVALVWAMRDRFISVAVSREPEPPAFKNATDMGSAVVSELESINGIGSTYADRLRAAGYNTAADLAGADPEQIAQIAGVGTTRARSWLDQIPR
ncbi:MAG: helix-hairpin-helix domain-containing protein [Acidimicrobiia bacterium]